MLNPADELHDADVRPAVLVVEDDLEVGEVVEEILSDVFHLKVTRAHNADQALQLAQWCKFDLVFTDIVMPGSMDGVGMARQMRQQYPDMPIVLTTGNAPKARLAETQAFHLIVKPYQVGELREMFRTAGLAV